VLIQLEDKALLPDSFKSIRGNVEVPLSIESETLRLLQVFKEWPNCAIRKNLKDPPRFLFRDVKEISGINGKERGGIQAFEENLEEGERRERLLTLGGGSQEGKQGET